MTRIRAQLANSSEAHGYLTSLQHFLRFAQCFSLIRIILKTLNAKTLVNNVLPFGSCVREDAASSLRCEGIYWCSVKSALFAEADPTDEDNVPSYEC